MLAMIPPYRLETRKAQFVFEAYGFIRHEDDRAAMRER
jgi:hypothetical protein